jgi:LysM repeat protein/lysophospholipase L1-like esterase
MKCLFILLFIFISSDFISQIKDSFNVNNFLVPIRSSPELSKAFSKLKRIHKKQTKEHFNIVHFGDSHIQGDFFSGEIRRLLQSEFGYSGQGLIFPYSLCKSYGPKGVKAATKGTWIGTNILKNTEKKNIGVTGYTLSTSNPNAELSIEITEKFTGKISKRICIWTSADSNSFDYQINDRFQLIEEKKINSNLKYRVYESDSNIQSFNLRLMKSYESNHQFYFHGFEFLSNEENGINYHHCGVVGAQFTHLVNNAELTLSQLTALKPDLIIFSFGTNEAYDQKVDTNFYYRSISNFIRNIQKSNSEVSIILTTAPDTRSQGRTPPNQRTVNRQLGRVAQDLDLSMFDLNEAMGGWGSLFRWYENKLTLDDKLHFNSNGYSLQGKMLTHSILKEYNHIYPNESIELKDLESQLEGSLRPLFSKKIKTEDLDTNSIEKRVETFKVNEKPLNKNKSTTHIVKSGDTVSTIARKYNSSVQKILKANKLQENTIIHPGQKLIIPKN